MTSVVNYAYDKNVISKIKDWNYGINWPSVYIIYNAHRAYVGETLDAVRRTEQHLQEPEFDEFTNICLISNKTFNKSVILDLESFLIKYMGSEGSKELTNGNAGVVNHNYFYKEAYEDDFKDIWQTLTNIGIVKKSLLDVENSEMFKYSPYKTLNYEQQNATYEILKRLYKINSATKESMIQVIGGAGTGKTILAVYIVKLLADINRNKKVWTSIEDEEISDLIRHLVIKMNGIRKIGFVVPMSELRETMKKIFKSIDGLSADMVLAPEEVVKEYYDVLVVDEAHRLYQRHHLPGQHMYAKFDRINRQLMSENFKGDVSDYTELDWIIKSSRIQIIFYDELQTIRATDIDRTRFKEICRPHLFAYYTLLSQMRCKGGNGYYDYVKAILEQENLTIRDYKKISNYQVKVMDSLDELFELIRQKNLQEGLCNVVCGPGWGLEEDIIIENQVLHWATGKEEKTDSKTVLSIHKSQGFDLNYAGVIFGKEIYYDKDKKRIEVNKRELKDNFTKSGGDEQMRQYLLNIYLTLMTRGINGTYVYAVDENLREYLMDYLNQS